MTMTRSPRLVPAVLFGVTLSALVLAPAAAGAVSMTYDGSRCHGASAEDERFLIRDSNTLTVASPGAHGNGNATVVCPIFKTTSGPNLTNDAIDYVRISGYSGNVACTATVYQTTGTSYGINTLEQASNAAYGYYYTYDLAISGTTNYWGNSTGWKYAELTCTIDANGYLSSYTVAEEGTIQTNRRIVSSANCSESTVDSWSNRFGLPFIPYRQSGSWGGFVEQDHVGFSPTCPLPAGAGTRVQIALGPSLNPTNLMGCRKASSNTWKRVKGAEYAIKTVTFDADTLVCGLQQDLEGGDAKILSYRTANSGIGTP